MGLAGPEAPRLAACRRLKEGERADHRDVLALLDKPVLDAKLDIAGTEEGGAGLGSIVGIGDYKVKLDVRRHPIVGLEVGGCAGEVSPVILILGGRVEFPVLVIHRFWVVRAERRAGKEGGYTGEDSKDHDGCGE